MMNHPEIDCTSIWASDVYRMKMTYERLKKVINNTTSQALDNSAFTMYYIITPIWNYKKRHNQLLSKNSLCNL